MNTLEKYASHCGVGWQKPEVSQSYFPIRDNAYIIIDNRNRMDSNIYELYLDVIEMLSGIFAEYKIDIYMFCSDGKYALAGTRPLVNLHPKQESFLVNNSLAVISSGNISTYTSSALGVPSIGLYSAVPASVMKPLWDDKHVAIESDRSGTLPSYGVEEKIRGINKIKPEDICNQLLKLLDKKERVDVESIHVGDIYQMKVVEVIPDFVPAPDFFLGKVINIRVDYCDDEANLIRWITGRQANLLIDKPLNLDLINYFKNSIVQITASIGDEFTEGWIKSAKKIGVNLELSCNDKDRIGDFRYKFFDHTVNENLFKKKSDMWEPDKFTNKTKFTTGKILISEGERYSCLSAKKAKRVLTNDPEVVYDDNEFWKELDHYRLFNEL